MNTIYNSDFNLFETMRYKNGKIFVFNNHLIRLLNSAKYFNFNTEIIINTIKPFLNNIYQNISYYKTSVSIESFNLYNDSLLWEDISNSKFMEILNKQYTFSNKCDLIIRLNLFKNGKLHFDILPYKDIICKNVVISKNKTCNKNLFLYHKTTNRDHYKDSINIIKNRDIFDILYFNKNNALCEGSRSNIVLNINNMYYTPCQTQGLLRGTLLSVFLESNICKEKVLYKNDLLNANKIFCINSVRGINEVSIIN